MLWNFGLAGRDGALLPTRIPSRSLSIRAARAVARACATNRLAVVVPRHRVVKASGDPGGYRRGAERKRRLLAEEGAKEGA